MNVGGGILSQRTECYCFYDQLRNWFASWAQSNSDALNETTIRNDGGLVNLWMEIVIGTIIVTSYDLDWSYGPTPLSLASLFFLSISILLVSPAVFHIFPLVPHICVRTARPASDAMHVNITVKFTFITFPHYQLEFPRYIRIVFNVCVVCGK